MSKRAGVNILEIDADYCFSEVIGNRGITKAQLKDTSDKVEAARQAVYAARDAGRADFMLLPYQDLEHLLTFARERHGRYDAVLVVGIGGSALGMVALANALLPFFYNELSREERKGYPRLYVLDNVDPDETQGLLARLDWSTTLVNVISKSGTTAESMAGFMIVREQIEKQLGPDALKDHLVFTTDPKRGLLREIGLRLDVPLFDIPPGVGGRFSVLSAVGLLPAAMCGMDIAALCAGARAMDEWLSQTQGWDNPACLFAGLCYLNDVIYGRRVTVMMPYAARLKEFAAWFRQLWAESLGKEMDRQGRKVNVGLLPVRAWGTTDQHSQLQLYAEGPDDKLITFLGVREFDSKLTIPAPTREEEALGWLGGKPLAELFWAEQRGTAWALARKGRPSLTITLPRVDAFTMGALLYLFEFATAVAGELYDINAFDQPGVELSKQATCALMGRPGFEDLAREIGAF